MTGYALHEHEFRQLIAERSYRARIARLLGGWGYRLAGFGPDTAVTDAADRPVDAALLHAEIQSDPARQRALYQVAMDCWR